MGAGDRDREAVAFPQGSSRKLAQITIEKKPMIEPFVDALQGAEFLAIRPRRLLEMARAGDVPAHPIGRGKRKQWRFRLSELADAFVAKGPTAAKSRSKASSIPAVPGNRIGGTR